jgi:AraC family transcriptional activator of pobA
VKRSAWQLDCEAADYARRLCVTSKHLRETVKAATGQMAGDWLATQVQRQARQPGRRLTQIADELGFSDASAFGKFFFWRTGQTLGAYR